ncbi:HPt (histidine-containing phosphotransfer) domain-containing protein [Verrucomicrobium sp. GAS474]|uniref:Hpt domain-containing protein n=1 Tax=Verrucomicrobium sp. GAS474 TaxID=1882831 RepID=UPI00087AE52A|nr:Hpt domain-containing protein [Verrucomicrobium sp. GAS474]SDT91067.1 HPt (histidine-containing phosphotransfer) domain-containing protein [Verrucomicrobium sp. GAS474]
MGTATLIDWTQLDLIRRECGSEAALIFADLVGEFDGQFQNFTKLVEIGDPTGVSRLAHQIKGSTSSFGFLAFAHLMRDIEARTKSGGPVPTPEELATARQLFNDSVALIHQERPDLNPA